MEALKWIADPPELRSPVLVAAFAGWNDAASAATTALEAVAVSLGAEPIAEIDPEEFYDFQVTRPTIRMAEGQTREVDWPANNIFAAVAPNAERDLVLVSGIEPNLRWRTFADAVRRGRRTARRRDGRNPRRAARRRPTHAFGADHRARLGPGSGRPPLTLALQLRGPNRDRRHHPRRLPSPRHYLGEPLGRRAALRRGGPNPKAALALLRRLEGFTGIAIEASELEEAMGRFETQVDRAVASNPEIEDLVRRLESEQSDEDDLDAEDVPSGDTIARDFQRFLRQRSDD